MFPSGYGIMGGVHAMHPSTVAIDSAKEVFALAFTDVQGLVIERRACIHSLTCDVTSVRSNA